MTNTLGLRPLAAIATVALFSTAGSRGSAAGTGTGRGGGNHTAATQD